MRNSPLGKWEKEGARENRMDHLATSPGPLGPVGMRTESKAACFPPLWRAAFDQGLIKGECQKKKRPSELRVCARKQSCAPMTDLGILIG